jgi:hypothetical protein
MVLNNSKFKGNVEFRGDREDYSGQVKISGGWVNIIETNEYIPSERIYCVTRIGQGTGMM